MRTYGRFTTGIVRDDEFRRLTAAQQGVYFLLGLQGEISAAGTLPLTLRRWAQQSAGMTVEDLRDELKLLEDHGHVLIDEDTEELLIVKFVKWDGGYTNSKRLPVIAEAAYAIVSPRLRHALGTEADRLGLSDIASRLLGNSPPDTPSDAVTPSDRVVVTEGEYVPQPQTATQEGEPSASDDADPPPMFCSKHPDGTEQPCGPCGTARARYKAHVAATVERAAAEKAARVAAARTCTECHGTGLREKPDGTPAGKCDHRRSA